MPIHCDTNFSYILYSGVFVSSSECDTNIIRGNILARKASINAIFKLLLRDFVLVLLLL